MTVYKPIRVIAKAAAQAAVDMANKKKIKTTMTVNNGKIDVPFLALEPIAVDKDNMYEVIVKDGFHKLGDVYRNVPKKDWPAQ